MTPSTTRVLRAGAPLVLAGVLWSGSALGQEDNEPLDIIPLEPVVAEEEPAVEEAVVEETPPDDAPPEPAAAATGLEVAALPAVDTNTVGTLDEETGGFRRDMWQRSDGAVVGKLLGLLDPGSGVALELSRRLLLTSSDPPEGVDDWLDRRIERLIALGLQHDAGELMDRAGLRTLGPAGRLARIDTLFLGGDSDAACREVRAVLESQDVPSLAPALVFCQRRDGQDAAADLSLAVLQDTGLDVDPAFLALDGALAASGPAALESLEGVTPLHFAMAVASGAAFSQASLGGASPPLLRAIADHAGTPVETRLAAAERCAALGIMSGSELGTLYREAQTGPEAGAPGRARLYRDAVGAVLDKERARHMAALVHHGARERDPAVFRAAARAAASQIVTMTPAPDLGWFSAEATLTLLAAGEPEEAARWWPLIERRALLDESAAAEAAVFWPLLRLWMGEDLADDGSGMERWWGTIAGVAPQRAHRMGSLYLVLMAALGDRAAEPLLDDILAGWDGRAEPAGEGESVRPGLLVALEAAARDGRLGETVLLSLVLLGPGGAAGADVPTLRSVIEALRQSGLESEARLLALEAAFANAV